jgi:phosphatidylglycerophosphatase C
MNVALYDFDGTIYKGDSSVEYALFCVRKDLRKVPSLIGFCLVFVLFKLSLVSKRTAKSWLFRMMEEDSYLLENFWSSKRQRFITPVVQMLESDLKNGSRVLVISASPRFLVSSGMEALQKPTVILATETKPKQPQTLESLNCFGSEKVQRFLRWRGEQGVPTSEIQISKVVSDRLHDLPLYQLGGRAYHVSVGILKEGLPDK